MITEETRKKISSKLVNVHKSEEHARNIKKGQQQKYAHLYKLTEVELNNFIFDYVHNKMSINQLVQKYDLTKKIATNYLKRNNVHIRTNSEAHFLHLPTDLEKKIINLYNDGKTLSQVSKELGVTRGKVYNTVVNKGCNRKKGQANIGSHLSDSTKQKISKANKGHKVNLQKQIDTKRKNGSFNLSNPEKEMLERLKEEYGEGNVEYQYKDSERYPYYCDFYVKSEDLFIELNKHWTHGYRPYIADDESCKEQLSMWVEKSKKSKFYRQAIYIWTDLDVRKLQCAKNNHLNYKIIY